MTSQANQANPSKIATWQSHDESRKRNFNFLRMTNECEFIFNV